MTTNNPFEQFIRLYAKDPVRFVREVLGADPLPYQAELMEMVAAGERKISVRSGHGTGKSSCASWVMLHYLLFNYPCKIIVTAPTSGQLFDALFAELKRWIGEMPQNLQELLTVKSDRVELKAAAAEAFISARTSRAETPEALAGVHCFAAGTMEVLTRAGWVALEDVSLSDDVLAKRPGDTVAHWENPLEVICSHYSGEMHGYKSKFLNYLVTPNHKFEYYKRQCNRTVGAGTTERWVHRVTPVSEMPRQKCRIPKIFDVVDAVRDCHVVPEYLSTRYGDPLLTRGGNGSALRPAKFIDIGDWAEFMGWFLAEGYTRDRTTAICQSLSANPEKYARIAALIERMGYSPNCDKNQIMIHDVQLSSYMRQIIEKGAENKSVPQHCFEMPKAAIRRLLDAFRAGDGCGDWEYFTSSPRLADDIQRLILLTGAYATVNFTSRKGTRVGGFEYKPPSYRSTDYYRIREWKGWGSDFAGVTVKDRYLTMYDGMVSCLSMPSGMFYVRDVETKHGFWTHNSEHVLLVVDEASAVPEPVFEAAAGSMSGHTATTLLLSNPTRTSGTFFETHNRMRESWVTRRWSCIDSPLVSDEFVDEMRERYGAESNAFKVRVLGDFPESDDDVLIPYHLIDDATKRDIEVDMGVGAVWGLDPARFGSDRTALCKRVGSVVTEVTSWRQLDTMATVGRVKAEFDALPPSLRPREIMVDSIGVGAGVVDRLRELGLPVRGINVSESPSMGQTYANLRAELWNKTKGWLEGRSCKIPEDDQLVAELSAVRYSFTSSGKLQIESKERMKARGLPSPDLADALVLTMAGDAAVAMGLGGLSWQKPLRRNLRGIA